jgi:hypothetical protein
METNASMDETINIFKLQFWHHITTRDIQSQYR